MTGIVFPRESNRLLAEFRDATLQRWTRNAEASEIDQRIRSLRSLPSPGSLPGMHLDTASRRPLTERLFDALASVKILTSQVAMHLDSEWRTRLFRQLDSLHDPEEWEEGDEPLQQSSFWTFLRAMLSIRPERAPGLGLASAGHLIASWATGPDHLTIEFLANDRVRWVLSRHNDDDVDRFAGDVPVARLEASLAAHHPEHWFSDAREDH